MQPAGRRTTGKIKTLLILGFLLSGGGIIPTTAQSLSEADRWRATGDSLHQAGRYDSSTWHLRKAAATYLEQGQWKNRVHCLLGVSDNYAETRQLDSAQQYALQALAYSQQKGTDRDFETSQAYLALSSTMIYQRQYDSARQYHQQAVASRKSPQSWSRLQVAQSYATLGRIFSGLRQLDSAQWCYRRGLHYLENLPQAYPLAVAELYLRLGASYGDEYLYDTAAYYYQKSLTLLQETWSSHPLVVKVYTNLAVDFRAKSDLDRSLAYLLKALAVQEQFPDDNDQTAACYQHVGILYLEQRAFSKAQEYLSRAVDLLEHSGDTRSLAVTYLSLGTNANHSRNFPLAKTSFQKALALWQGSANPDSTLLCSIYNNMGVGYEKAEKQDSALLYFQRALAVAQRIKQKNPVSLATYHHNVGNVYVTRGKIDSAQWHARQALSIRQSTFGKKHAGVASSWTLLGEIYHQQGYPQRALHSLQQALAADIIDFDDTVSTRNPPASSQYLDAYELLDALHFKAIVLLSDRPTVKEARRALHTLYLSDSVIDQLQRTYQTHDDQVTLKERAKETYQLAVAACMHLFDQADDPTYAHRAFYFSEKSKASVLTQALAEVSAQHRAGIPDSLLRQERSLSIDRAYYTSRMQTEKTRPSTDSSEVRYCQDHLFTINRQYDSLIRLLERQYPHYYTMKYRNPVIALPELQQQLPDNATLVSSFLSDSLLYQFVVTADTLRVVTQGYDSTLTETIVQLRSTLTPEAVTELSQDTYRTYTRSASSLYRHLLGSVLPPVPVGNSSPVPPPLIVVPDGVLGYVPYDVLLTRPPAAHVPDYRHLPYLLNHYNVSYAYSATWRFKPRKGREVQTTQELIAFASATDPTAPESAPLAWNESEVNKVSSYLTTRQYTGSQAQERYFKEEANQYQFIHLAMHGYADSEDPLASKLVFSPNQDTAHHEDNILYAHELYDMQLSADLAVLSACQTGAGTLAEGEGILSLARAFAYAGCASVVMSHWAADDESTATLIDYFYRYLSEEKTKDQALSEAKRTFLAEAPAALTHPYYWGNFMLVGATEPITTSSSPYPVYLMLGGLLLLGAAALVGHQLTQRASSRRQPVSGH